MPCEFETQRPNRYRFHDSIGCQFDCPDQELIIYDGKSWCPAHVSNDLEIEDVEASHIIERRRIEFIRLSIENEFEKLKNDDANDYIDLSGVVFPDSYVLHFHRKLPNIIFNECEFHNRPSFTDCTFFGDTWFEGSSFFKGGPSFLRSKFKSGARFDEASFCSGTTFTGAHFSDFVDFSGASFENVTFFEAIFRSEVSFSNAELKEFTSFNQTEFHGKAIFFGTRFNQGLRLDVKGPILANFREAELNGPIFFSGTEFKALILADAKFGNGKTINSSPRVVAQSSGYPAPDSSADLREDLASFVNFDGMVCEGIFDFSASHFLRGDDGFILPKATFVKSRFLGEATFENRIFGASTSFSDARFKRAPEFHGCTLHQDTNFEETRFLDISSAHAFRAYRTLKQEMENVRARKQEADFFALEQKSLRGQQTTPLSIKITSWLYEILSDYGRSFLRPVCLLVGSVLYFFALYIGILRAAGSENNLIGTSITLSMKQIVRPFWIWVEQNEQIAEVSASSIYIIKFFANIQSILSIVLISLFLLALRRRFKMD